jgi:uncharacterized surface protein with fasciclin (FAS1) repeats
MTLIRLLTTVAAVSLLTSLAPLAAQAQTPPTATAKTEKAAAAATGKASTDAPANTAVQGTARAVQESAKPAADQAPAATAPAPAAAPAPLAKPVVANGDLTSTLRLSGQFTTFVKALDATNLSGLLQTRPGLTVFAPTDAAFAALPPGKLDALMADKPGLQKLLLHHIINAPVPAAKIKGARGPIPSGAGDNIIIDGSADVLKADNANIIQSDVSASNGTLHVVDQVLIAGSVPATLPEAAPEPTPEPTPAPPAKPKAASKKK